jgi:hypothetical protein
MCESIQFLETLQHDNPDRPRFTIRSGVYENLEISFRGQVMCIPMAEVLTFTRRWDADFESRRAARQVEGSLVLFPYPLMSVNMNDPDFGNLHWWPEP